MSTIRDLAKRAGVSVATVSRVINKHPNVADETRQKILRLAEELDFRPNAAARTLKTQRSRIMGVFIKDHTNSDLLLFANLTEGGGDTYLKRCRHHRVDGVVLMGVDRVDPGLVELVSSDTPCMLIDVDRVGQRAGYVHSDHVDGAQQAVRHLAGLGHTRIAMIAGFPTSRASQERLVGYRQSLEQLGLPYRPEYVRNGNFTRAGGYAATRALLSFPYPPTAIFAGGDLMAFVGFDDPASDPPVISLPTKLVVRESCGAHR